MNRPVPPRPVHWRPSDLRAAARLAVEATLGVTGVVEQLHGTILGRAPPLGPARPAATGGVTGLVYRGVRHATRLVGGTLDAALARVQSWLEDSQSAAPPGSDAREAVLAALNGVLGDHLEATGSPLAIPMTLWHGGHPLPHRVQPPDLPRATGRLLLMVHGLCMNPRQWQRDGSDLGQRVASACGGTVLHLHYNSGRSVASNGHELAARLEELLASWPVPLQEIVIVGHSMGGLVARSACLQAAAHGHAWPHRLRALVFLGTPHLGAPLERGGHGLEVLLHASPYTAAFARLGGLRSAGIVDLREGRLLDDVGQPGGAGPVRLHARAGLPAGADCFAVAGLLGPARTRIGARWLGDGLVPVDSALGRHPDRSRSLRLPARHRMVARGEGHFELLHSPQVLAQLVRWIGPAGAAAGTSNAR